MAPALQPILWAPEPNPDTYPAAFDYLELLFPTEVALDLTRELETTKTVTKRINDVFRAAQLPVLPETDPGVARCLDRVADGQLWSPVLFIRGSRGESLIIADGYHRCCAAFAVSEYTPVRCRIV